MRILDPSGQYRISVTTGIIAAALAAGAQLFQFKWVPPSAAAAFTQQATLAILLKLRARFLPLTPFTAATLGDHTSLNAFNVRSYALGGGGTALTLTGNNAKMDNGMPTSLAAINVSTTAALTAATTLDAQPFAQSLRTGNRVNPAAATEEVIQPTFDWLDYAPDFAGGERPRILHSGEGIVIANRTVWPAAGTGVYQFDITWAEAQSVNF
jgi:hypothetical protein